VTRTTELRCAGLVYITHLEVSNEKKTEVREVAGKLHSWNLDLDGRTILNKP
jgi:hypothetical protein